MDGTVLYYCTDTRRVLYMAVESGIPDSSALIANIGSPVIGTPVSGINEEGR